MRAARIWASSGLEGTPKKTSLEEVRTVGNTAGDIVYTAVDSGATQLGAAVEGLSGLHDFEAIDGGLGAVKTVVVGLDIVEPVEVAVGGAASEEYNSTGVGMSTGGEGVSGRGVDKDARLATAA